MIIRLSAKLLFIPIILIITALVLTAGCISDGSNTYVVGIESSASPPSIIYTDDGTLTGFDVEAIEWIAEQEGFHIVFKPTSWQNIIPSLQAGQLDLIFSAMTITEDRAKLVSFTDPYLSVGLGVAARAGTQWTLEDVYAGEVDIAVQRGTTANEILKATLDEQDPNLYSQMLFDGSVLLFSSVDELIDAVLSGKTDVCIIDDTIPLSFMRTEPDLVMIGIVPTGEAYGAAVRKEDTELLNILNEGIAKFVNSTKRDELEAKYL